MADRTVQQIEDDKTEAIYKQLAAVAARLTAKPKTQWKLGEKPLLALKQLNDEDALDAFRGVHCEHDDITKLLGEWEDLLDELQTHTPNVARCIIVKNDTLAYYVANHCLSSDDDEESDKEKDSDEKEQVDG